MQAVGGLQGSNTNQLVKQDWIYKGLLLDTYCLPNQIFGNELDLSRNYSLFCKLSMKNETPTLSM